METKMQTEDGHIVEPEPEAIKSMPIPEINNWEHFRDDDIMLRHSAIQAEEAMKVPFIGDKEPISSLAVEYQLGSPILLEKIKVLAAQFTAIRRTRGDGNCFFRSFMFAYLVCPLISLLDVLHISLRISTLMLQEFYSSYCKLCDQNIQDHILESQDRPEVDRITVNVEQCRKTLLSLGHAEFTFEDCFALFLEQLESVVPRCEIPISHDELVERSRDQSTSDYVVMFFRFITSGEIRKRSEFYEPFIHGLTNMSVEQFCKSSVEPMGEESDHVHITALSDALGIPIRIVYLDRSCDDKGHVSVNHHDFSPLATDSTKANACCSEAHKPFITLLYRPGHYDILYPK